MVDVIAIADAIFWFEFGLGEFMLGHLKSMYFFLL